MQYDVCETKCVRACARATALLHAADSRNRWAAKLYLSFALSCAHYWMLMHSAGSFSLEGVKRLLSIRMHSTVQVVALRDETVFNAALLACQRRLGIALEDEISVLPGLQQQTKCPPFLQMRMPCHIAGEFVTDILYIRNNEGRALPVASS
eukprot:6205970-Pleurochrysis_carterae.AAC.9